MTEYTLASSYQHNILLRNCISYRTRCCFCTSCSPFVYFCLRSFQFRLSKLSTSMSEWLLALVVYWHCCRRRSAYSISCSTSSPSSSSTIQRFALIFSKSLFFIADERVLIIAVMKKNNLLCLYAYQIYSSETSKRKYNWSITKKREYFHRRKIWLCFTYPIGAESIIVLDQKLNAISLSA